MGFSECKTLFYLSRSTIGLNYGALLQGFSTVIFPAMRRFSRKDNQNFPKPMRRILIRLVKRGSALSRCARGHLYFHWIKMTCSMLSFALMKIVEKSANMWLCSSARFQLVLSPEAFQALRMQTFFPHQCWLSYINATLID